MKVLFGVCLTFQFTRAEMCVFLSISSYIKCIGGALA